MNTARLAGLVAFVVVAWTFSPHSRAESTGSLKHVHELLLQAAGESSEHMPPAEQQKSLLGDALKELRHIPHVYHGDLNRAKRDIQAALEEIESGDASHKARPDILEAADIIKLDAE